MTAEQPHVTLADGVRMPQFGLGVWRTPAADAAAVVSAAVEAGYRAVDTASAYGNEEGVGDALADHPDVFLTTKLWNSDQGYDETLRAFEASAKRLRRPAVDLYLIHWPAPAKNRYVDSWKALVRLKGEGRARAIGVSNFGEEHLARAMEATGVTPSLNQVELHPRFQQRALRAVHERHGIRTESWSPLGQGRLLDDPLLAELGRKHGRTPAQVVIRWHIESGLVVIPKSANPERLRQNVDVFGFQLDAGDRDRLAALDAPDGRIGPDPATAAF